MLVCVRYGFGFNLVFFIWFWWLVFFLLFLVGDCFCVLVFLSVLFGFLWFWCCFVVWALFGFVLLVCVLWFGLVFCLCVVLCYFLVCVFFCLFWLLVLFGVFLFCFGVLGLGFILLLFGLSVCVLFRVRYIEHKFDDK